MGNKRSVIGGISLGIIAVAFVLYALLEQHDVERQAPSDETVLSPVSQTKPFQEEMFEEPLTTPVVRLVPSLSLELPFRIEDISTERGVVNPFGVVRFSADRSDAGHSGIDFPLAHGADILAVADGTIVRIVSSEDPWNGMSIFQLLVQTAEGEGWGFIYEHVTPLSGIQEGMVVQKGDVLATKSAPEDFTAHFQLSYLFNTFEYIEHTQCWPNFLSDAAQDTLLTWWDTFRFSTQLTESWNSVLQEGTYPFRELLDATIYPNGPQLCYKLGTDVR